MKFYKNIGIFITIITLIVIALNVFFYTSFYNQQLKSHSIIISKQAKLCGNQVEDNINDFKNDLNFYFNKNDIYQLFDEKNTQSEAVRKLRQFFIKYNDLISSIEIIDNKGNKFIFNGNSENYFNKAYKESINQEILFKNTAYYNSANKLIYTSVIKNGNDIIANVNLKLELNAYFEIAFRQYHINNQYFQSLIDHKGNIIYHNLLTGEINFSNRYLIEDAINHNFEDLISQKVQYNDKNEKIISGIYPIDILGYKYGLVFSEKKSSIYDVVIRKTGLISFFTILTFIIIIIIFQSLVKSLKQNEIVLKQRNLDLEQLTFSASHHLQEPLRKIFIFSDRLSLKMNSEIYNQEIDYIKKIQNFALIMRQMLNGLLLYSEINLKGNKFKIIDLNELLLSLINQKTEYLSLNKNIFINHLPDIKGDDEQVRTLFNQILDNSINFAKKDLPLKIEIFQGEKSNNYDQIIIKDNGKGFDSKYNELIFEPFQQLAPEEGNNRYGIGLTLARKIVERHRGKIFIYGNPNEGCTIKIDFYKKLKNG